MLDILAYRAAELSKINPGELFVFKQVGELLYALRVKDERDENSTPAVVLQKGKVPQYMAFQTGASGLVIGRPTVKVLPGLPESCTPSDSAEGPGSLLIAESAHLIASAARADEVMIELSSGNVKRFPPRPRWYVTRWQLGLEDRWGEFEKLYEWPPPK